MIDPDRPSLRTASCRAPRRRNDRQPHRLPRTGKPALKTPTTTLLPQPESRTSNFDLPALNSMRRTAPPSRPYGRYAVGLRPSLDSDAYFDAPSQDQEAPKQAKTTAAVVLTGPAPSGMTCRSPTRRSPSRARAIRSPPRPPWTASTCCAPACPSRLSPTTM